MANYDLTYEGSEVQKILDTGDELQTAGYIFRGEATPSTVPGTPTERVAYIGGPGTYTNFGSSITVGAGCICVFKYTGSAWSNQVINTGLDSAVNTLQSAITAINNNIGNGYVYAGVATTSTSPVTGKVFYLAVQAGTYTNFGNAVVTAGLNVIKYNGSTWSVDQVIAIDAEPTQGSANLVKSGGVLNSIIQNGPAFDLSAYNAQGGVLATYADLSAALTALNALPAAYKKGGMSLKFVQSSDNKYVQYRLMADSWSTNTEDWAVYNIEVYKDIPSYLYVIEINNRLLFAIKEDGDIVFGIGVPTKIKKYIDEKIAELSLEYEDIVSFLGYLIAGDKTLQQLLNEKVDKVTGKGLIDSNYSESINSVDSNQYRELTVNDEREILEAIKSDGIKYTYIPNKFKKIILNDDTEIDNIDDILGNIPSTINTISNKVDALENIIGQQSLQDNLAPVPVIFDTDFGGDVDDAIALRIISYYETIGSIRIASIAGIANGGNSRKVAQGINAVMEYDGTIDVPVFTPNEPINDDAVGYCGEAATYPHTLLTSSSYGVRAYRKALASLDRKGIIVAVGPLTFVNNLLNSPADDISELNGSELIAAKIQKFFIMGGAYPSSAEIIPGGAAESNWRGSTNGAAASNFMSNCPVPIILCGWEIGYAVRVGGECYSNLPTNDIIIHLMNWWYHTYFPEGSEQNNIIYTGRDGFDPVTTAIACVGNPKKLGFDMVRGTCIVDASTGSNTFVESPSGNHYYVTLKYDADYYKIILNNIIAKRIWGCNNTSVLDRTVF